LYVEPAIVPGGRLNVSGGVERGLLGRVCLESSLCGMSSSAWFCLNGGGPAAFVGGSSFTAGFPLGRGGSGFGLAEEVA